MGDTHDEINNFEKKNYNSIKDSDEKQLEGTERSTFEVSDPLSDNF